MLTATSHINIFTGYQDQPNIPSQGTSSVKNQPGADRAANTDEVTLSRKGKELQQIYGKKETALEQKYASESQQLESEYLRGKNSLENEYRQKKQALEIDLYV